VTVEQNEEQAEPNQTMQRNDLLRRARLRRPSPRDPTCPMSQRELAEAVTAHVFRTTKRDVPLDRHYISRLERGRSRWPVADYRDAFRVVLGVATDAELGFYVKQRVPGSRSAPPAPTPGIAANRGATELLDGDTASVQLVISPGMAIVLVPVEAVTLAVLVSSRSSA